jgi:hypothetical protein
MLPPDAHHGYSAEAITHPWLTELETVCRAAAPATPGEVHALFDAVHTIVSTLPTVGAQLAADGHLCRLIDDQADAAEARR